MFIKKIIALDRKIQLLERVHQRLVSASQETVRLENKRTRPVTNVLQSYVLQIFYNSKEIKIIYLLGKYYCALTLLQTTLGYKAWPKLCQLFTKMFTVKIKASLNNKILFDFVLNSIIYHFVSVCTLSFKIWYITVLNKYIYLSK